jgi:hypothetical protein
MTDPYIEVPHYSTDLSAAWQLVERIREPGHAFHLSRFDPCIWLATFRDDGYAAQAETAPLAICRAALKAVRE